MPRKIVYIDNFLLEHGATPTTGVTLTQLFAQHGYNVIRAGTKQNKAARLIEMLQSIRRNRDATVLIAVYSTSAFYFAWACARLCRMLGVRYVPCLHGGNLPERIEKNTGMCAQIFAHGYTNVVVSGYLQQSVVKHGWRCLLIPNNINLTVYPFLLREIVRPKLLWVRSFHTIYNPQLAVKILQALQANYPGASLTMVGPDKDGSLEICKKLADSLGVSAHIQFTGKLSQAEWVKLSASHDIFINTTNFDNLPVSVIEAMALGMPVVSTNVGGLEFLITSGIDGVLVDADDLDSFVSAIQRFVQDAAFTKTISLNARKTAETFDVGPVMQLWRQLLDAD